MNQRSTQICNQIKVKVKNRLGEPEFKHNDEVIELALEMLVQHLKKNKELK